MIELYRFRSITSLFEDYQELENQSVYFASPEELNDPMEGFRIYFWQGDEIVWRNFFKRYIYCLYLTYGLVTIAGENKTVEHDDIPVMASIGQLENLPAKYLFEDIYEKVFQKTELESLIKKIVNSDRKLHRDEVLFYLYLLHYDAIQGILNTHIDYALAPESARLEVNSSSIWKTAQDIPELVQHIEIEGFADIAFAVQSRMIANQHMIHKYNAIVQPANFPDSNGQLLILDFPEVYLKQLENSIYPDWYAACFMKDYRNSSVWGHYGENHKGACLIFEAGTSTGGNSLTLNHIQDEHLGPINLNFYDISYKDKAPEIDFFRSIGQLSLPVLLKDWYSDEAGNLSECGIHLETNKEEAWRKNYWNSFTRNITVKAQDWNYEKESRLILSNTFYDLDEKRRRTLNYDFRSLKGVIFGISTSDKDKFKIINTIKKKCHENNRTDFEFFQAYYSHKTSDIQKYKIDLKFSS